jgi:hypothetical protein
VAIWAQIGVDHTREAQPEELLYLPNERLLNHFTAGMDSVVADLLWIQCVQYTGKQLRGERDFRWLEQMVNTVVRLDPYFVDAYRYGAMFLASLNAEDDAALHLLERGAIINPHAAMLPYEMAMVYMLNRRDWPDAKKMAALYLGIAARRPDAPAFVPELASTLQSAYDLVEFEEQMWRDRLAMALASGDELIAQMSRRKLDEVHVRRQIGILNTLIGQYEARTGKTPQDWKALAEAGLVPPDRLSAFESDGLGGRYIIDKAGMAQSTALLADQRNKAMNQLRSALDKYRRKEGAWPPSLDALVSKGYLIVVPAHPYAGEAWHYDPQSGELR